MKRFTRVAPVALVGLVVPSFAWAQAGSAGYDPRRDPQRDLQAAIYEAKAGAKRIILEVGGEWCGWCHLLERFAHEDPEVRQLWSGAFVTVKVNMSEENRNERFLARVPVHSRLSAPLRARQRRHAAAVAADQRARVGPRLLAGARAGVPQPLGAARLAQPLTGRRAL